MGRILTIDEMLTAMRHLNEDEFQRHRRSVENVATQLAAALCRELNIKMDPRGASFEGLELGGTACHLYAKDRNQPLPAGLSGFDPSGDWRVYGVDFVLPGEA